MLCLTISNKNGYQQSSSCHIVTYVCKRCLFLGLIRPFDSGQPHKPVGCDAISCAGLNMNRKEKRKANRHYLVLVLSIVLTTLRKHCFVNNNFLDCRRRKSTSRQKESVGESPFGPAVDRHFATVPPPLRSPPRRRFVVLPPLTFHVRSICLHVVWWRRRRLHCLALFCPGMPYYAQAKNASTYTRSFLNQLRSSYCPASMVCTTELLVKD